MSFLVKKILRGCHQLGPSKDTRLPITRYFAKTIEYIRQYKYRIICTNDN